MAGLLDEQGVHDLTGLRSCMRTTPPAQRALSKQFCILKASFPPPPHSTITTSNNYYEYEAKMQQALDTLPKKKPNISQTARDIGVSVIEP